MAYVLSSFFIVFHCRLLAFSCPFHPSLRNLIVYSLTLFHIVNLMFTGLSMVLWFSESLKFVQSHDSRHWWNASVFRLSLTRNIPAGSQVYHRVKCPLGSNTLPLISQLFDALLLLASMTPLNIVLARLYGTLESYVCQPKNSSSVSSLQ